MKLTLVHLFQPSPPTISPANPTATEGRPFNLTCSSVGGSPPPQIKWYKLGYSQMLDATILRGENKDEPTRSILNVVPTKNDDGASFRCTVWNRALRQEHSLEAGTKVFVNCKFLSLLLRVCARGSLSQSQLCRVRAQFCIIYHLTVCCVYAFILHCQHTSFQQ